MTYPGQRPEPPSLFPHFLLSQVMEDDKRESIIKDITANLWKEVRFPEAQNKS